MTSQVSASNNQMSVFTNLQEALPAIESVEVHEPTAAAGTDTTKGSNYKAEHPLGEGSFSVVYLATNSASKKQYAVKATKSTSISDCNSFIDEGRILGSLQQFRPYFPKLIEGDSELLVLGLLPKDSYHEYMHPKKIIPWNLLLGASYQLHISTKILEKMNTAHRDIKPENFYINAQSGVATLGDLGSAMKVDKMVKGERVVSRFYRPPEVILAQDLNCSMDWWSVGCTIAELALGSPLFPSQGDDRLYATKIDHLRHIVSRNGPLPKECAKDNVVAKNFMENLEKTCPTANRNGAVLYTFLIDRLKRRYPNVPIGEINSFANLVKRLLKLKPEKRISPSEALLHNVYENHLYIEIHRGPSKPGREYHLCIFPYPADKEDTPLIEANMLKHRYVHQMVPRSKENQYRVCLFDNKSNLLKEKVVKLRFGSRIEIGNGDFDAHNIVRRTEEGKDEGKRDDQKRN